MNTIRIEQTGWEENRLREAMFQNPLSESWGKMLDLTTRAGMPRTDRRYGKNGVNRARFLPASSEALQTLLVCKNFKPLPNTPAWRREKGKTLFAPANAEEFARFLEEYEGLAAMFNSSSARDSYADAIRSYHTEFRAPESGRKFFLKKPSQPDALRHSFPEPAFGFFRRDKDISEIEKRLLFRNNLLFVRGRFGAGKTTLLNYLAAWWQTTGLAGHVFYFDYEKEIRTRDEILSAIAERIFPAEEFSGDFQSLSEKIIQEKLREERHILIFDHAGVLPKSHRQDIQEFLNGLSGGKTLVLIASDEKEPEPLNQFQLLAGDNNVYELRGLNFRTASMLAKRILERHEIGDFQRDADFQKLLARLKGYPLALELILPLLKRYTPSQVSGMLKFSSPDGKKAALPGIGTILRCIEFVFRFPHVRDLLICLAPFISVINAKGIECYTEKLRQQPELAHLPFDLLPELIREAGVYGFLAPNQNISAFSEVQPFFSYVLKAGLYAPGKEAVRHAVETAFREYYEAMSKASRRVIGSNSMLAKELEYLLIEPEYENLTEALNISLNSCMPIVNLYRTLSDYSNRNRKREYGSDLGKVILSGVEKYPQEVLKGSTGLEFVRILDEIGRRHLLCKSYSEAEQAYTKALTVWLGNETYPAEHIRRGSAALYHQLGRVAQEQGHWEQAREFFLEDLKITKECNDRHGIMVTLRNLYHLWKESKNEEIPDAVEAVVC